MAWHLYLMRHGIAAERFEPGIHSDADRPLTDRGRRRVRLVAQAMQSMDVQPGLVISSPYVRAKQTAEIVCEVLGIEALEFDDRLTPMADPHAVRDLLIEHHHHGEDVLFTGHQPHMSSTLSYLLSGGMGVALEMRKAGLACLRFPGFSQHPPAQLDWLLTPRWISRMFPNEEW